MFHVGQLVTFRNPTTKNSREAILRITEIETTGSCRIICESIHFLIPHFEDITNKWEGLPFLPTSLKPYTPITIKEL